METKRSIAEYLKQGAEGLYFHRMVETVLCRDKNWVRWKIESCPSIERPAVTPAEHNSAKSAARKTTTNKKIRAKPLGSLDLSFLTEADGARGMEKLKDASRHQLPNLDSFKNKIALDEMEIEMPTSDETKEAAINSKASKSWRALRIASKTKLAAFDKIEDPEKIDVIFQEETVQPKSVKKSSMDSMEATGNPSSTDRPAIVIAGPLGVGKSTLIDMLLGKYAKVFVKTISHTSRHSRDGEIDGVHYYFVSKDKYGIMRDGDQFLEHSSLDGDDYGTSFKAVESIVASGRIPVMEMSHSVSPEDLHVYVYSIHNHIKLHLEYYVLTYL
jgi:THO complex subunit 1